MKNKEITLKIENLWEEDQKIRTNKKIPLETLREHDEVQTEEVKGLYLKHGIISSRKYPIETVNKFTILVQHALDLQFAEKYLKDLIKNGTKEDKKKTPFLIDKILVTQGKKQIYGTIVSTKTEADGSLTTKPKPVLDPEKLDERRKEAGLIPMKEYLLKAEELYTKISR